MRTLKEHGVTCIYITHKLEEFFRITDSITVLRDGKAVTTQPTTQLTQEKLVSYMVGREMKERFPKGNRKPGEVIFEVEDLHAVDPNETSRKVLKGVTFNLRRGEISGHCRPDGFRAHRTGDDDFWRVRQDYGRHDQAGGQRTA